MHDFEDQLQLSHPGEDGMALEMSLERGAVLRNPDRGAPTVMLRDRFYNLEDDRSSMKSTGSLAVIDTDRSSSEATCPPHSTSCAALTPFVSLIFLVAPDVGRELRR